MRPELENEYGPLAPERLRSAGEGIVEDRAVEKLLVGTPWNHQRRRTSVGAAHVFTRPVTLLESLRADPTEHQNHRHVLGTTRTPEGLLLTYMVLRDVHAGDLRVLPAIDSGMSGRGRIGRERFPDHELRVMELPWLSFREIAEVTDLAETTARDFSNNARARYGLNTRAKLTVLGLQEGFISPRLERWYGQWPELSPALAEVLPYAHLENAETAELLEATPEAIRERFARVYEETGTSNRSELVLAALANGAVALRDLIVEIGEPALSESERDVLGLADWPVAGIAAELVMSVKSVNDHRASLRAKLGLRSRLEVALFAFREGKLREGRDRSLAESFTPEQREIAPHIGHGNKVIAEKTGLKHWTVKQLAAEMLEQVGAQDRVGLAVFLARAGLLDPDDYIRPRIASV